MKTPKPTKKKIGKLTIKQAAHNKTVHMQYDAGDYNEEIFIDAKDLMTVIQTLCLWWIWYEEKKK